jgi:hypothetical protein
VLAKCDVSIYLIQTPFPTRHGTAVFNRAVRSA